MLLRSLAPAAMTLAIALASGCGDDDEQGGSGVASAIPPDPVLYLEADISGEGEQHENLDATLDELGEVPLLGSAVDPKALIADALEDLGRDNGIEISYEEDFEPWLGETLAVGYTSLSDDDAAFVLSIDVEDEEIARDSVERITAADAAEETDEEYDGVSYQRSVTGEYAVGVFDDNFVLATADAFEGAVDASRGDSIATSDDLADALEVLPDDRLGVLYLDTGAALDLAVQDGDAEPSEAEAARAAAPEIFEQPLVGSLSAGERTLAMDFAVGHSDDGVQVAGTDRLGKAPEDAFVALGLAALGDQIEAIVERIDPIVEEEGGPSLATQFESATDVRLDEMLASAGDAIAYARGDLAEDEVLGTLEVELLGDSDAPARLLDGLEELAREEGLRVGPPLGDGSTGFSAVLSTPDSGPLTLYNAHLEADHLALSSASPPEAAEQPAAEGTLGENELFQAAAASLGDDYEMIGFADLGPILDSVVGDSSLLDLATGAATPEQAIAGFLADKLGFAAAGIRYDGDRAIQRVVVGLR
jgi:Protein of unknown function (DUF3352)